MGNPGIFRRYCPDARDGIILFDYVATANYVTSANFRCSSDFPLDTMVYFCLDYSNHYFPNNLHDCPSFLSAEYMSDINNQEHEKEYEEMTFISSAASWIILIVF